MKNILLPVHLKLNLLSCIHTLYLSNAMQFALSIFKIRVELLPKSLFSSNNSLQVPMNTSFANKKKVSVSEIKKKRKEK